MNQTKLAIFLLASSLLVSFTAQAQTSDEESAYGEIALDDSSQPEDEFTDDTPAVEDEFSENQGEDQAEEPVGPIVQEEQEEDYAPAEFDSEPLPTLYREDAPADVRLRNKPKKIRHPYAKKGLIRIDKNKVYTYKVTSSPQDRTSSVRFGSYNPSNLKASSDDGDVYYGDIYDDTESAILFFDYEWNWLKGSLGKLNYKLGSGIFTASGNGRFKDQNSSLEAREEFSLYIFPNNLGLVYRAQFSDSQWLVPFVDGGLDPIAFMESRDDGGSPKFGGTIHAHAAGGAAFSLQGLSRESMLDLDREYGINSIWLTVEYRLLIPIMNKFDFSGSIINGGIMAEF